MRQVGVLAAAGPAWPSSASTGWPRTTPGRSGWPQAAADRWPGSVDPALVQTNIVRIEVPDPAAVLAPPRRPRASWPCPAAPPCVRLVTHADVDDADIDRAVAAIADAPEAP